MISFEVLGDKVGAFAGRFVENKYLATLRDSFIAIIPFTIVGAISILIGSVLFGETMLGGISGLEFLQDFQPLFNAINYASMNFLAIFVAYYIGYNLARNFNVDNPVYAGILSLASFVILVPTSIVFDPENVNEVVDNVLSVNVTGSQGLIIAILGGIIVTRFYVALLGVKKLKITLHESVPDNVARSFSSLIPTIIVMFTVGIFSYVFIELTGRHVSVAVYELLQLPLEAVMQHPLGILFSVFFAHLLWVFGIHGSSIVNGIIDPMLLSALATNSDLVARGLEPTEIVTRPFWNMYGTMGGVGNTFALILVLLIFSKRDDEKTIAKLGAGPGFFGINEPITFGLPIVFNPIYAIPFIIAPLVTSSIGYFATAIGFAAPAIAMVPWSMPPLINGFLATGGDIGAVLTQLFGLIVTFLIYLPFVKLSNKQIEGKENTEKANAKQTKKARNQGVAVEVDKN